MNLPNRLTVLRLLLAFFLMAFLYMQGFWPKVLALVFFVAAAGTDFFDGWLARRNGQVTDFGKIMDPLADKVLVLGAFLSFLELRLISSWMVIIIISRELLITGFRFLALRRGLVLAAESAGKHKTVSQMMTIFFILVFLVFRESSFAIGQRSSLFYQTAIFWLMVLTVGLTAISGFSFVWQNRKIIRSF